VESDATVSIEPEHATRNTSTPEAHYAVIPGYGRTLSGVTLLPVTVNTQKAESSPRLEYDMYLFSPSSNGSIVNVTVVERATAPLEPENGLLMPLLIGLMSGLLVGAGMAIAVEYLNRRLRFEEEVERYLELPVLAVIPELHTAPDVAHG